MAATSATTSAAANMDPSGDRQRLLGLQQQQQPQLEQQIKQYQGYSVSTVPLDQNQGREERVEREERVMNEEEEGSDEEEVDYELEKMLLRPPPAPVPGQLAKFHHQLKVGVFVATVEVLTDRCNNDLGEIRKNAQKIVDDLVKSTGEVFEEELPGRPLCGTPRIKRDYRKMSRHVKYLSGLCNKFIEEFDGSEERVKKLRQATGFIKGILAREGEEVFNISEKPVITEFGDMLDIFRVNAMLFIEFITSHGAFAIQRQ